MYFFSGKKNYLKPVIWCGQDEFEKLSLWYLFVLKIYNLTFLLFLITDFLPFSMCMCFKLDFNVLYEHHNYQLSTMFKNMF